MKINKDFEKAQKLRNNGQIEDALILYSEVRQDALDKKNRQLASECLHMIGVAYYQIEKFEDADTRLVQALNEFEEADNLEYAGFVLRDLGMSARGQKKLPEAKRYLEESIAKLKKAQNKAHEGMSHVKLGRIIAEMGDFDKGYQEVNLGLNLLKNTKDKFFLSSAYLDRAKLDAHMSLKILDSFAAKDEFLERRKCIKNFL